MRSATTSDLDWSPTSKPERVTAPRHRRKPAQGSPPSAPLPLPPLPARPLPEAPAEAEPAGQPASAAAPAAAVTAPDVSALLAGGTALYSRETLQGRLDLDDAEFAELVGEGWLSEVTVLGRLRYAMNVSPLAASGTTVR